MNLFVSNISRTAKDPALHDLFSQFGMVVSAKIISDKYTGESRGFGFVEMSTDAEGAEAISKLSNATFFGRKLGVAAAKPKTDPVKSGNNLI